jgi:hypothetical protein
MGNDYKTRFTAKTIIEEKVEPIIGKPQSLFKEKMIRVGIVGSGSKILLCKLTKIVLFLGGLYGFYKYYQVKSFEG